MDDQREAAMTMQGEEIRARACEDDHVVIEVRIEGVIVVEAHLDPGLALDALVNDIARAREMIAERHRRRTMN